MGHLLGSLRIFFLEWVDLGSPGWLAANIRFFLGGGLLFGFLYNQIDRIYVDSVSFIPRTVVVSGFGSTSAGSFGWSSGGAQIILVKVPLIIFSIRVVVLKLLFLITRIIAMDRVYHIPGVGAGNSRPVHLGFAFSGKMSWFSTFVAYILVCRFLLGSRTFLVVALGLVAIVVTPLVLGIQLVGPSVPKILSAPARIISTILVHNVCFQFGKTSDEIFPVWF
jgi:hypothetical protein